MHYFRTYRTIPISHDFGDCAIPGRQSTARPELTMRTSMHRKPGILSGDIPTSSSLFIDTGADLNHSDLQVNILPRGTEDWDFADPIDPSPDDSDSHGTHVAGIVAAVDNTVGVSALLPDAG